MAERMRYYTQNGEDTRIPELQELAEAQNAPAEGTRQLQTVPPSYDSSGRERQSELFEQIANRGPFQYDVTKDPLYGIAKDRYVQGGRMAMKDTMGQATALTGGFGSSYGQVAGQQAYDRQLQGLADMIPELYQTAYAKYQDEENRMRDLYDMAGSMADKDYSRYRDELGDWQYERAWQQQMDDAAYDRQSDAYSRLYSLIGSTGYMPSDDELAAAGMTQEAANALRTEYLRQTGQLPKSGGSVGGGYYPTQESSLPEGTTVADYMRFLRQNGFSADEAWDYLSDYGVNRVTKPGEQKKDEKKGKVVKPTPAPGGGKKTRQAK